MNKVGSATRAVFRLFQLSIPLKDILRLRCFKSLCGTETGTNRDIIGPILGYLGVLFR